jgi:metal transporter CNNM
MLVTLLLCNALALETLPIFLSKAVSEFVAIIFAVFGVLVVGEIIP